MKDNTEKSLNLENLKRFHVYSLNYDGSTGVFLGDIYAESAKEALEDATKTFLKFFKNGVKVVDINLN